MKYTVFSWDGVKVDTISHLTPGGAAKTAVEERGFQPGFLVVVDEFGERTTVRVKETRLVYAYEVKE